VGVYGLGVVHACVRTCMRAYVHTYVCMCVQLFITWPLPDANLISDHIFNYNKTTLI